MPPDMTLTHDDLRVIAGWAESCATRVLPIFEKAAPDDLRPREALDGIRGFASGGKRAASLRKLSMAALAAAREVDSPAAKAAARSACMAASSAYTHPLATADQARHILGPAVYASLAREEAGGQPAVEGEIQHAISQACPALREILRRFPAQPAGKTRLAKLYQQLDNSLRGGV